MNFNPIKPQKGYELVMNQIRESIRSGELKPGDKLASVVDLAASFGVGRSTLREALSALKAMGWLYIQQGGGTYVAHQLPIEGDDEPVALFAKAESLKEMVEVRKVLETGGAMLAASKRTEQDLTALRAILERMAEHIEDEVTGEEADVEFHLQIARSTHNGLHLQMMESLSQRLQESMKEYRKLWFYGARASANRLLQEHQEIYQAIAAQEENRAYEVMLRHLARVESVLKQREV